MDGDWLKAIASYNCGEGRVRKAIEKNISAGLPTDFWSLDLPQETRDYIPRLLAMSAIIASPAWISIILSLDHIARDGCRLGFHNPA